MIGLGKRSSELNDVGLIEVPVPEPQAGNVVLEVLGVGVCGTDLHIIRNEYPSRPPVILGHEVCGRVVAAGAGVEPRVMGGRFVSETYFSTCGRCAHCRNGRPNLCLERRSIGSHVNGAMAGFVEVPTKNLHVPPQGLSDAAASLSEPLACVTNSLFGQAGGHIEPGDSVLVFGPGPIGLIAAQVARSMGGEVTLVGTEKDAKRLELAARLGFETSTSAHSLPEDHFDKVIECSGAPQALARSLLHLTRAGHLIVMGLSGRESALAFDLVCFKELTITSGFASTPRSWQRAMRLEYSGDVDLESLVTEVAPLKDWSRILERSFSADGVKFVFDPRLDA